MRLIEKYYQLKTDEERNKYYSELSPEDKAVLNKEYADLDPFGLDADCRWDEVREVCARIYNLYLYAVESDKYKSRRKEIDEIKETLWKETDKLKYSAQIKQLKEELIFAKTLERQKFEYKDGSIR